MCGPNSGKYLLLFSPPHLYSTHDASHSFLAIHLQVRLHTGITSASAACNSRPINYYDIYHVGGKSVKTMCGAWRDSIDITAGLCGPNAEQVWAGAIGQVMLATWWVQPYIMWSRVGSGKKMTCAEVLVSILDELW